jgi:hypothetical protein
MRLSLLPDDSGMIPAWWICWMEALDAMGFSEGYQGVILVAGERHQRYLQELFDAAA